jgi:hypothetical protein
MVKILKVLVLSFAFLGFTTSLWAQEAQLVNADTSYSSRFDHETDDGVMANLEKIKQSGLGYRFGEGSSFGVQVKNGVQVGLKVRFF